MLLKDFLKICRITRLPTMKYGHNNKKKCKNVRSELLIHVLWSYVYLFKSLKKKKKEYFIFLNVFTVFATIRKTIADRK